MEDSTLPDLLASSSSLNLSSSTSQSYLDHLTALPLPSLLDEPSALQTQSHHLTSSLTSLTNTSYPAFLSLHKSTAALSSSLDSLSSSLDALVTTSLPTLESCVGGWKAGTGDVLDERKKARVVLEQYEKVRDLLDVPVLIDTCVRNGYFGEALSLVSHAKALEARFTTTNVRPKILASVLAEVEHSVMQMLLVLLGTLHEPSRKLPALWKAVNFLRKMEVFGPSADEGDRDDGVSAEEQIALAFLSGREACLRSSLEACGRDVERLVSAGDELADRDREDIARFLKKYIDLWREGVYDIITQYSTIFLERSPSPASLQQTLADIQIPTSNPLLPLLTTYATHALTTHLLSLVTRALPLLSMSALPALLTQLTYCATAFSRVGMDFRGILTGMVGAAVLSAVGKELRNAGTKWVARVKRASAAAAQRDGGGNISRKGGKKKERPSEWLIVSPLAAAPPTPSATPVAVLAPPSIPPQILASYPPLAEYTNALLTVLNGLRPLAPLGAMQDLVRVLEDVLREGGDVLREYVMEWTPRVGSEVAGSDGAGDEGEEGVGNDGEGGGVTEGEREKIVADAAGEVYEVVFVPYMRRALVEGVYGVKMGDWDSEKHVVPSPGD